jgi:hypothetical protein
VALPRAYAPTSIAVSVSGASKLPLYDKAVVLEVYLFFLHLVPDESDK